MQDSIQTQQAPATQQNSIPSSAPVPNAGYQQTQAQTAQPSYQTPSDPSVQQAVAPQAIPQVAPQVQAPVQEVNPWQEAFKSLSDSLSATPTSQPQAAYSTPTPQQAQTSSLASQQTYQAAPSVSGMQTYQPQATPAYSPTQQVQAQPSIQQEVTPSGDGYLDNVSNESLEVLQHFGSEAPALLNRYACTVEDALLQQANQTQEAFTRIEKLSQNIEGAKKVVDAAAADNAAYHTMLTNPDMLSEYVNEFFGPNGPHPVEIAQDRLAAEVAANEARMGQTQQPQAAPAAPAPQAAPAQEAPVGQTPTQQFQRPQMDIPSPGVQASRGGDDFWASFSNLSDQNPAAAWQALSSATPEQLRSKLLVSEG